QGVTFGRMLFHGLALAVVGFLRMPPWRYRRLGLGESIQLQGSSRFFVTQHVYLQLCPQKHAGTNTTIS
ncbi:hypothetical protein, partial [Pseudomonas sp. DSP3-2-2]|uniref:hypothetical protein n=1 Tax=unclassified Pseudomonas TaxID=196821 RepID=UPI003CF8B4D0